ncbi:hypothetical protein FB554_0453 [Barrientosiimonas humi]|uniref:Uncharacterized protein n=1 Tax=Barrientosiimonas humi TaxID=999931 RepID=A0A542X922_9MICO|nr:hypothetical protein FB554_0453 [Barrientosiimonas humi]CAG7572320.1 hypothetical protein BH39T_PBIAJDOK_00934 [Barrientosiimonas humi]
MARKTIALALSFPMVFAVSAPRAEALGLHVQRLPTDNKLRWYAAYLNDDYVRNSSACGPVDRVRAKIAFQAVATSNGMSIRNPRITNLTLGYEFGSGSLNGKTGSLKWISGPSSRWVVGTEMELVTYLSGKTINIYQPWGNSPTFNLGVTIKGRPYCGAIFQVRFTR